MRKFGLIGFPLGHSFSKKYFTEKFAREGYSDCIYENYPLENISLFRQLIATEPELCGLNVTIPYKSEVISNLDEISDEAAEIGAVNVIRFIRNDDGLKLCGYNSDITGIHDTISPFTGSITKKAIVLGTGGSSKAVNYVLRKLGFEIVQVSRSGGRGVATYDELTSDQIRDSGLIVNCTPLGMYPDTESFPPIDYSALTAGHLLFDLVYNPEITVFLAKGQERGAMTAGGLKMLHSQAEKAWTIWNDEE